MKKRYLLLILLIMTLLVGCDSEVQISKDHVLNTGGAYKTEVLNNGNPKEEDLLEQSESEDEIDDTKLTPTIKILSIFHVEIESDNLEEDIDTLETRIHQINGYIRSHNIKDSIDKKYLRTATVSVRIPKKEATQFIGYLKDGFLITKEASETVDATETYFDLELKIKSIDKQEEQLLKMYESTANIEDMLKINQRLTDLSMEKSKLTVDYEHKKERMNYTTIDITINEVEDMLDGLSLNERIDKTFSKMSVAFNKIASNVIILLIHLSPIIVILIIVFFAHKKIKYKLINSALLNTKNIEIEETQNLDNLENEEILEQKVLETMDEEVENIETDEDMKNMEIENQEIND